MIFSAGSIKDLVGNSYAGTTFYDFTTEEPVLIPVIWYQCHAGALFRPGNSHRMEQRVMKVSPCTPT